MKFRVMMKCPDALRDAVHDAVKDEIQNRKDLETTDDDARNYAAKERIDAVNDICAKWFRYGEYLRVEVDTDAETCVVIPAKEVVRR